MRCRYLAESRDGYIQSAGLDEALGWAVDQRTTVRITMPMGIIVDIATGGTVSDAVASIYDQTDPDSMEPWQVSELMRQIARIEEE